jgi:alkaline phosphatase D
MFMRKCFFLSLFLGLLGIANAQNKWVLAGPMPGYVEFRTAKIWVELGAGAKNAAIKYWKADAPKAMQIKPFSGNFNAHFKTIQITLTDLAINTTYNYEIIVNGRPTKKGGSFTTTNLWQYQKPVPNFSFLTGSCAYFNEPGFDRLFTDMVLLNQPAIPYGGDSTIFETMAKEKAAFMLWLGDNWYTRDADYGSEWGLWYRAHRDRSLPVLQNFLKAMPHYAIWDDHDYGPNDADKSYILKEQSREVFMNYWANPSYGLGGQGIYTKLGYADCDFFLMDDRWFRSSDYMSAFIDGKPNAEKRMWGKQQMDWLKNQLLMSKAPFKFIVTGSQTLNPASKSDCLQDYPIEYNELMDFFKIEKINGVLFLTGDRHHSEVIKMERQGLYPLYDITSSPLTSGVSKVQGQELTNAARVTGTLVEALNYTRISISGKGRERVLKAEFLGVKGEKLAEWSVSENELRVPPAIK